MQILRSTEVERAKAAGYSVRTMVLSADGFDSVVDRVSGFGFQVECEDELYSALDKLLTDPSGYGLFIMDADAFGGLAAAERAFHLLGDVAQRLPVILLSSECDEQVFPQGRDAPLVLRAPVSAMSMKVGLDHALRSRTALYA